MLACNVLTPFLSVLQGLLGSVAIHRTASPSRRQRCKYAVSRSDAQSAAFAHRHASHLPVWLGRRVVYAVVSG